MTVHRFWMGILLLAGSLPLAAFTAADLDSLDRELALQPEYDRIKKQRIDSIERSDMASYAKYALLFDEYKSYSYDTAYIYAGKMMDEARLLGDARKIDAACIKHAFIYLSSGLFHESLAAFQSLNPESLSPDEQRDYYTNYARLLYDMADYAHGDISYGYTRQGNLLSQQALQLISPNDTVLYWSTSGLYYMKMSDYPHAIEQFKMALSCSTITEHERAIAYSSMAYLYGLLHRQDVAEHYWVLAAIADIRSSTNETVALAIVAEELYKQGDTERAVRYIRSAMDDAAFYHARHRQMSVGRILPIIEHKQMQDLESKNRRIERLSIALYVLLGLLLITLIVLANRIRAIHRAHRTIERINAGLMEANRIKEEYIGASCCNISDLIRRMEKYEHYVQRKVMDKQTNELTVVPNYVDAHRCRKDFYRQFDESFLRIFPHFIEQFNALLRKGEALEVKPGEILSTELRIFALIRLGITDNEQISKVLDYSINTVYTYKTRVRNRSNLNNDAFLQSVMSIPSFE